MRFSKKKIILFIMNGKIIINKSQNPHNDYNTIEKVFCLNAKKLKYFSKKPLKLKENFQLFSEDIYYTGAKRFFFSTHNNLYKIIKMNKVNNFYEDITFNDKIKLFIDVDENIFFRTDLHQKKYIQKMLPIILNEIEKLILKEFNIKKTRIIVLRSKNLKKFSLHIIFPDIIFDNIKMMKYFMQNIKMKIVDQCVYRNGAFRMMLNSKKNKNNKLILYQIFNFECDNEKSLFLESCICYCDSKIKTVTYNYIETIKKQLITCKKKYTKKRDYKYIDINFEKIEEILNELKHFSNDYNNWLLVAFSLKEIYLGSSIKDKKSIYKLFDNFSKNGNNYDEKNNRNIFMKLKPFDFNSNILFSMSKNYFKLIPIYDHNKLLFNDKNHKNIIKLKQNYLTSLDDKVEDYIKQLFEYDIIYIKSPTGTGKTTLIKKLKNKLGSKFISITSRVNLASEHIKFGLEFYKTMTSYNIYNSSNLVIQLESLIKCNTDNFKNGIILLDEVNSLLSHFRSTTMADRRADCYLYLIELLKNTNKIICLDADISDWNIKFIQSIRKDKYCVLYNTIKNKQNINSYFYNSADILINILEERIKNNDFFVSCFDSKNYMKKIIDYLINKGANKEDFLIYSSDEKVTFIDTKQWINKFVFYTPTILFGIDYNEKMTDVFCFINKMHLNPIQIYQMINRTRQIKNVYIYCHKNRINNKYRCLEDVEDETNYMVNSLNKLIECNYEINEEPYKIMYNNYKYLDSILKTNILYYLQTIMKEKGFIIKNNNDQLNENINLKKINKKKKMNDYIIEILKLDKSNLTEQQLELVTNETKIKQFFNYQLLIDNNLIYKIKDLIKDNLILESINNRYSKILLCKNFMHNLEIYKLEDLNKDISKKFTSKINNLWINDNLEYIKKVFRKTPRKYLKNCYYKNYIFLISIIKQLFGNIIIKKKVKINKKEYYYYIFNNIYINY